MGYKSVSVGKLEDPDHGDWYGFACYYPNGVAMARLGQMPGTSRVALEICDETGVVKALAGELTDGDYGLAVVNPAGELVKLGDFVFGPQVHEVTTQQSRSSTTFGDLATVGPTVTVNVGQTGRVLVLYACQIGWIDNNTDGAVGGEAGIEVTGATSRPVGDDQRLRAFTQSGGTTYNSANFQLANMKFFTGLNPGLHTFRMKYRSLTAGKNCDFDNRSIAVFPY